MKPKAVLFAVSILVLIGAGIYFLTAPGQRASRNGSDDVIVGGDRDEHGCIGSAGYSWCEEKGKCLRLWEEPCNGEAPDAQRTEELQEAIASLIAAKHSLSADEPVVSVNNIEGDYASGGVTFGDGLGGGGMWFAAFTEGSWKLVWDGNGTVMCEDVEPYPGFPSSLIPSCYDNVSGTMVER